MSTDREHLRKQLGGFALIASPLLGLAGAVVAPALDKDEEAWLGNIAEAADRASWGTILGALSMVTGIFAVLALTHMLRERKATYGQFGGGLAIVGLVLTSMFLGMEAMTNELATGSVDRGTAATLVKDATTNPVAVLAWAGSAAFAVGLLVLAIGLYRAEVVPRASAVGIGLFAIGMTAAYAAFLSPLLVAAFVVFAVALLPVGWHVLREGDEAWEHTPKFRGFHTAQTA